MIRRKRSLKRYQSCKCQTFKHARHLLPAAANDDNDEIGKRGMAFNIPCKVGCDSGIWKFSRRGYFHIERWICSRGSNIVHRNTKQISLKLYCQTLICRRRNGSRHTHAHTHRVTVTCELLSNAHAADQIAQRELQCIHNQHSSLRTNRNWKKRSPYEL